MDIYNIDYSFHNRLQKFYKSEREGGASKTWKCVRNTLFQLLNYDLYNVLCSVYPKDVQTYILCKYMVHCYIVGRYSWYYT